MKLVRYLTIFHLMTLGLLIVLFSSSTVHAYHANSFRNAEVALNSTIPASLSFEIGVANGQSRELVYLEDKGQKISELQWEIDNVVLVGVEGSFDFTDWLRFNGGFWTNLTEGDNGRMDDYDWGIPADPRGWESCYNSRANVEQVFITDSNIEAVLLKTKYVDISGLIGFKFDNWKWDSKDGIFTYSFNSWRGDQMTFPKGQSVIGYEQWFYTPYLGVQTNSDFGNFKLKTYVKGTICAWGEDEDHHYLRNLRFNEHIYNIKYIGAGVSGSYSFTPNIFSTITCDYQKYFRQIGHTKITDTTTGETSKTSNSAGMDHESFFLGIELGFNF